MIKPFPALLRVMVLVVMAMSSAGHAQTAASGAPPANPDYAAPDSTSRSAAPATSSSAVLGRWGVETQYINSAIRPGDDFYRYVNDGWLRTTKPPPGMPSANAFVEALLRTEARLRDLLRAIEQAPVTPARGSDEQLVGALYRSYVDVERRNALGLAPIKAELDALLSLSSHAEVARAMAQPFVMSFVAVSVASDEKQPQRYVLHAEQAGLGLPAREYYLLPGATYVAHRAAYRSYIENTFARAGIDAANSRAAAVLKLETAIAQAQWSATEMRDPLRSYHLLAVAELAHYAPGFPWADHLTASGVGTQRDIVLTTDTAIVKLAQLFAVTPLATLQSYLAFHFLDSLAPALSAPWQEAHFAFHGAELAGTPEQRSLDERGIDFVSAHLGELLGRLYVQRYFSAAARAQTASMVEHLRAAFRARLQANTWMDDTTRTAALRKLAAITCHVGYPDRWRDYRDLQINAQDLIGNWRRIEEYELKDSIKALGETRRDWQWQYPAMEINAGYEAERNAITFPAGILQAPFFDPGADAAVNFGAIGAIIGHEMGHAFDDEGSQSDETGALRNWWTSAARREFQRRVAVLVTQFNGYAPFKDLHVNGALTLGENIGDLGGLTIAYDAYRSYLDEAEHGHAAQLDGFSGEQRFFLSYAQVWRDITTPDQLRQDLLSDPHSPAQFRANGTLRNFEPWYEAFGVKRGDALYLPPRQRAAIW